jgi:hypothetical protein
VTGQTDCWGWCDGVGFIILVTMTIYFLLLYYFCIKPNVEELLSGKWHSLYYYESKVLQYFEGRTWTRIGTYLTVLGLGTFPKNIEN